MADSPSNGVPMEESLFMSKLWRIFPVFANTLDINAFARLSAASQTIRNRCLNDRMIRIQLEEYEITVTTTARGSPTFSLRAVDVAERNIKMYLKTLRRFKCNVSLRKLCIQCIMTPAIWVKTRRFLAGIGVKKIHSLILKRQCNDWEQTYSFVKDFSVQNVDISTSLSKEVLNSVLQWNVKSVVYRSDARGEDILRMDSQIPRITILNMASSADVFMQILWKIHTGTLKTLIVAEDKVPWNDYPSFSSNEDVDLPNERPLLIKYKNGHASKKWFLQICGFVSKCVKLEKVVEISKCDPEDYPLALQSKELVHNAMAEKRPFRCTKGHFASFFGGYSVVESSHEGPLPEDRPLLFKFTSSRSIYLLLNEDGSIDSYSWEDEAATCRSFDMETSFPDVPHKHFSLTKFLVDKYIQKRSLHVRVDCESIEDFRKLYDDFSACALSHSYSRRLPKERPLVFERTISNGKKKESYYIVLYGDGQLIQHHFDGSGSVSIEPCPSWNLPTIMLLKQHFKEIVLNAPLIDLTYSIDADGFSNAFKGLKTVPFHFFGDLPAERPLVFQKTLLKRSDSLEKRWMLLESGDVRRCLWQDGQALLSRADPKEFPLSLTKEFIKNFLRDGKITAEDLFVDGRVLKEQLEEYEIVDFDASPTSYDKRPLVFQKPDLQFIGCNAEALKLWHLSSEDVVTYLLWGRKQERHLNFSTYEFARLTKRKELPPALDSKEMLHYFVHKSRPNSDLSYRWRGGYTDFCDYFNGHRTLDFSYDGRLPKARPLVFKYRNDRPVFWFLRKDDVLIKCTYAGEAILDFETDDWKRPYCLRSSKNHS